MPRPTRRDEAWHAILVTVAETSFGDTFDVDDVLATAEDHDLDVAERTIRKALNVMVDFEYLHERDPGVYVLDGTFANAVAQPTFREGEQ